MHWHFDIESVNVDFQLKPNQKTLSVDRKRKKMMMMMVENGTERTNRRNNSKSLPKKNEMKWKQSKGKEC